MSEQFLERLVASQTALIAALDSGDVQLIEQATSALAEAVENVRSQHVFRTGGSERNLLDQALKQNDAARMRVNYLADWNRQKIDRLAELRGGAPVLTYTSGR